jgi:hypothetical protein
LPLADRRELPFDFLPIQLLLGPFARVGIELLLVAGRFEPDAAFADARRDRKLQFDPVAFSFLGFDRLFDAAVPR